MPMWETDLNDMLRPKCTEARANSKNSKHIRPKARNGRPTHADFLRGDSDPKWTRSRSGIGEPKHAVPTVEEYNPAWP